jgi:hypothetical protein
VNADFSILVRNRRGYDVLSALSATERFDSSLVTFVQAGLGAVVRTAQAKMRDTVSVKDFGAVGDGVTDDTAAIQAALDYCESQSGGRGWVVYAPTGQYRCTGKLVVKGYTRFVGENYFSTSLFWDSTYTSGNCVELGPSALNPGRSFGSRIENMSLSGQDVYRGLDSAMVYTNTAQQYSGLYNVLIRRFRSIGVHLDLNAPGPANFSLFQVELQGSATAPTAGTTIGVKCNSGGAYIYAADLIVQGVSSNVMSAGVYMEQDNLVLTGGHFEHCSNAIYLAQNDPAAIKFNTITGVTGHNSVPVLVGVASTINLQYSLNAVSNVNILGTNVAVLNDLNAGVNVGGVGGRSLVSYTSTNLEPRLSRKVSNNNDAYQFEVTKRTQSSGSGDVILQITVPAGVYFIGVEAFLIGSRANATGVGTSQLQRAYFSIARNGSGSDVVLDNNPGTFNQAATTTTAGGAANKAAISPNIVRAGAEPNTDPQVVNITVTSGTAAGTTGTVVGNFKVMVIGAVTGVVVA